MSSSTSDFRIFENAAQQDSTLKWYAIADSAQHRALPDALVQDTNSVRCLFTISQGSPVARKSPHLVELCSPSENSSAWNWIRMNGKSQPCLTIIATSIAFDTLFCQLAEFTEVALPDSFVMFFGFWDPAILGTLMGQPDDLTLHVKGPVLSSEQRSVLTRGLAAWWYWDRAGQIHALPVSPSAHPGLRVPITLTQQQADELVEASVPDHLLYYLELNQPFLFTDVPSEKRYQMVRHALVRAREIGLFVMQDLVNYICVELIYQERMRTDVAIINILARVRDGRLTFAAAINELP